MGVLNSFMPSLGLPLGLSSGDYFHVVADTLSVEGNSYSVAHGLGEIPSLIVAGIECSTANLGYSIGDRVYLQTMKMNSNNGSGVTWWGDGTNVGYGMHSSATPYIPHKVPNSTLNAVTTTSWKPFVYAFNSNIATFVRGALDDPTQVVRNTAVTIATASWGAYEPDITALGYSATDRVFMSPANVHTTNTAVRGISGYIEPGTAVGMVAGEDSMHCHAKTGGNLNGLDLDGYQSYAYITANETGSDTYTDTTPAINSTVAMTTGLTDYPALVWHYWENVSGGADEGYNDGTQLQAVPTTFSASNLSRGLWVCVEADFNILLLNGGSSGEDRCLHRTTFLNGTIGDTEWNGGVKWWA